MLAFLARNRDKFKTPRRIVGARNKIKGYKNPTVANRLN